MWPKECGGQYGFNSKVARMDCTWRGAGLACLNPSLGCASTLRTTNLSRKQFGLSEVHRRSLLKQPALSAGHRHLYDYPTPSHLNVLWEFGSLGGIGLHVQIVTGIVLAVLLFDPRFGFGGDYAG